MTFPGPHCELAGISTENLINKSLPKHERLTNGLVLEITEFGRKTNLTLNEICEIFVHINCQFQDVKPQTLHSRVSTLKDKKKKLVSKKKVPGYKNVQDLLNGEFVPCIKAKINRVVSGGNLTEPSTQTQCFSNENGVCQVTEVCKPQINSLLCSTKNSCVQTDFETNDTDIEVTKKWNFKKYLCNTQTRKLRKIQKQIKLEEETLTSFRGRVGHYSLKNVKKRDETARKNLRLLRDSQRNLRTQQTKLKRSEMLNKEYLEKIKLLEKQVVSFEQELQLVRAKLEVEKSRKVSAQKSNSKLRLKYSQAENKNKDKLEEFDNNVTLMKKQIVLLSENITERDMMMSDLEHELTEQKKIQTNVITKNENGTFTENMRMCVIQLAGLEVATEKVSPVIDAVSQNLFNKKFSVNELPNSSTVQSIVDEGHYVAKLYLKDRIQNSEYWGLNRDGTTRRKQKIVDTSVTLENGEIASLGFTHIARETAQTIQNVTKGHLYELSGITATKTEEEQSVSEEFIINSLAKLAFTMSDRASNEKLADKFLVEWRDNMLENCKSETEIKTVKHFHCMAHVLLGFHKYICDDLKLFEKNLVESNGPLGRDSLPAFKFWSKKGTLVERVVRTTADIFGPAGEHLGVRDRWEAYCAKKGIKSIIGNYRDNRFNGLFQTAAEVLVHRMDFLDVINTVSDANLKIQAVAADLKSTEILSFLTCLGYLYVKVTGPYWELVTKGKVAYVQLYLHIQNLYKYLLACAKNPQILLGTDSNWTDQEYDISNKDRLLNVLSGYVLTENILYSVIKLMCKAMVRTIEKQLSDFLENGVFAKEADEKTLISTKFAKLTNLGCEHHFGDLDSSQKRRPNASMHHHSSIQLLKRNRKQMKKWYDEMTFEEKQQLWKNARKGGKIMRLKHTEQEKRVSNEICQIMERPAKKQNKGYYTYEDESDISEDLTRHLPNAEKINVHDYVAVAYQDAWYPGCVLKKDTNTMQVKFMTHCKKPGTYMWPSRDDIQTVNNEFLLAAGMVPECLSSGRQWSFPTYKDIDELFCTYKEMFF